MTRAEIVQNLAIHLKDQLTNPTYRAVRYDHSDASYQGAADAMLGYIEGKLQTPWDRLSEIFCPVPRIVQPEYQGKDRRHEQQR